MYTVHAVVFKTVNGTTTRHEVLIHDNMSPSHEMHLIDPKLKLADSTSGSFSMTIPPYNPGYSLVQRFVSTIKIYKGTTLIWTGRPMTEQMDFWNRRTIACEGALAFLNDTVQPIAYYGVGRSPAYILRTLLDIHNSRVQADRRLQVGVVNDFSSDEYGSYIFQTNNGSTLDEIRQNITERFDCHITMHYSSDGTAYVDIYKDYPNTAVQQINFGDNLLDFTRDWNMSNLSTVILPRGAQLDAETSDGQKAYITLKSEYDDVTPIADGTYSIGSSTDAITVSGSYIVNNSLYSQYGRVEKIVDFSDSTSPSDLFTLAKNYIAAQQFDDMTIKVSVVDLHNLTKSIPSFNLLDNIYCISVPHGMYGNWFPIVEMDIPLDKPENTTFTLSNNFRKTSLANIFGNFKTAIRNTANNMPSIGHVLDLAKIEASSIINRKTTGYVNVINMFDNDEEGVAQAIVISSTPDWKTANRYWIWNMNGLGYYDATRSAEIANQASETGQIPIYSTVDTTIGSSNRFYDLAITMDGTIVADRIKTGLLTDSQGYNYWNLETGEFRLQPRTQLYYGSGSEDYIDLFDLVYNADKAYNRNTGAENYLNGSKDWANWTNNGWSIYTDNTAASAGNPNAFDVVLMSPTVHSKKYSELKGYRLVFSLEGTSVGTWGEPSSTNALVISLSLVDSTGYRCAKQDKVLTYDTHYSRRYTTFDLLDSEFDIIDSYINNSAYICIWIYNKSSHNVTIRRPKLERGNTPTDWCVSDWDIDNEAQNKANTAYNSAVQVIGNELETVKTDIVKDYTTAMKQITGEMNKFTNEVEKAEQSFREHFNSVKEASLTQASVFNALTNNGTEQGIYLYNGKIYLNGTYVKSGTIDAAYVQTGVIADKNENSVWDLVKGYLETNNAKLVNATVTGQFSTGTNTGSRTEIRDGKITFYWDDGYVGTIVTKGFTNSSNIVIDASNLNIRANNLTWALGSDRNTPMLGGAVSATVDTNIVTALYNWGDGNISWDTKRLVMTVAYGVITHILFY